MIAPKPKILIVALCVAIAATAWFWCVRPRLMLSKGVAELTQASVWADLQAIEFRHRSMKGLEVPLLLKGAIESGGYDVLGVSSKDTQFPFVWIVLNTNAGVNGIYTMPHNSDFELACSYLRELESRERIDSKVLLFLQSHCQPSGKTS